MDAGGVVRRGRRMRDSHRTLEHYLNCTRNVTRDRHVKESSLDDRCLWDVRV